MKKLVNITRKTTESTMSVTLDMNGLTEDYRKKIQTPFPFLSHMIEHTAWRAEFGIETSITLDEFFLSHVVTEDLGMTFGKAVKLYVEENALEGVVGFGHGIGIIDEAKAAVCLSFENRTLFLMDTHDVVVPTEVEGMASEDIATFLEGFAQGANCTMQIDIVRGSNAHHIWEAVYRAFGIALREVTSLRESRKGMTSGVAGKIVYEQKIQ